MLARQEPIGVNHRRNLRRNQSPLYWDADIVSAWGVYQLPNLRSRLMNWLRRWCYRRCRSRNQRRRCCKIRRLDYVVHHIHNHRIMRIFQSFFDVAVIAAIAIAIATTAITIFPVFQCVCSYSTR